MMDADAQHYIEQLGDLRAGMVNSMRQNNAWEGFKRTLSDLYPDEAHFIYELLQNAEDAQATNAKFDLQPNKLTFTHDGKRLFKNEDVESITNIGHSTKRDDLNQIGKFGVGFKAVFAYSSTPRIYSGNFSFEIRDLFVPHWLVENLPTTGETRFEFPFNGSKPPQRCVAEVSTWLKQVKDNVLLFLRSVRSIRWTTGDGTWTQVERHELSNDVVEIHYSSSGSMSRDRSHWLRFIEPVEQGSPLYVAVAFEMKPLEAEAQTLFEKQLFLGKIVPTVGQLSIYFPAEKEKTGLYFHLHGPYASTIARDSIPASHLGNQQLLRSTAKLLATSMSKVKSMQLLTSEFLEVLPNPSDELPSFYQPILDELLRVFKTQALVPVDRGGHAPASSLFKGPARIREIIAKEDLALFCDSSIAQWVAGVMESQRADKFLGALGIRDWLWTNLHSTMLRKFGGNGDVKSATWLVGKDDEWLQSFYALLKQMIEEQDLHTSLYGGWRSEEARLQVQEWRIVRRQDGQHVAGGHAFFPDKGGAIPEFPIVNPTVLEGKRPKQIEAARQFLVAMGVRSVEERDRIALVLTRHYAPTAPPVDWKTHVDHLRWFVRWWTENSEDTTIFRNSALFLGVQQQRLKPADAFLDAPLTETGLTALFTGSRAVLKKRSPLYPDYAKASIPKFIQFAESCGVLARISICKTTTANNSQYHELRSAGGKRTAYETDEDYTIHDLDALLAANNVGVSALIWKTIAAAPGGVLQARYCANYQAPYRYAPSQLVCDLREAAWIPDKTGHFLRPSDIRRENLPEGFICDDRNGWLTAIGFESNLKKESAATQEKRKVAASLGIPPEAVEILEQLPEAARKEALNIFLNELRRRKSHTDHPGEPPMGFADQISKSFDHPDKRPPSSRLADDSPVTDPARRRHQTDEEIEAARKNEPAADDRSRIAARKVWESKNTDVRAFLVEQYNGHCQICNATFTKRDGENYFEARYLVTRSERGATWLDRPGNVLCLCATCCAKLQYGSIESPENIVEQIRALKTSRESGDHSLEVRINLCHEEVAVRFTERHLIEIQQILASEKTKPVTEVTLAGPSPTEPPKAATIVQIVPGSVSSLIQCPHCQSKVRQDRLQSHIARVHSSSPSRFRTHPPSTPYKSMATSSLPRCRGCGRPAVPGDDYCYSCRAH
jgi:hypothetical protein